MKSETFAAPEGICLFCDETEDLETVNLDGWNEEVCESCLDPNNWASETFEAFDPADAWDNFMHQQEMALEAYQEYLDYSGEEPLMTFEEWGEWQADLEDEYLQQQWEEMQEEDEPSPEDDPEYTTLEGTLDSETFESKSSPYWHELPKWDDVALFPCEYILPHGGELRRCRRDATTQKHWGNFCNKHQRVSDVMGHRIKQRMFEQQEKEKQEEMARRDRMTKEDFFQDIFESPVSCKICGKTFDSFRGLNGHMNAHLPPHRKRAEGCEHEWQMTELPLERGHKYHVGWVNAAGIPSYHMVCIKCNYCTDCSGTHGFLAETFEAPKKTKQEIITYMLSNCEDWDEYSYRYTVNDEQWTLADLFIRQWLNNGWDGFGMNNVEEVYRYLVDNKELLIEYDLVSPDGINNSGIPLWDNYDFEAETFAAEYCPTCQIPEHDSCSLTDGCPCCEDTMIGIYRRAEDEEQTIEDFFVDMSDLLTKYSGGNWDWDSGSP